MGGETMEKMPMPSQDSSVGLSANKNAARIGLIALVALVVVCFSVVIAGATLSAESGQQEVPAQGN